MPHKLVVVLATLCLIGSPQAYGYLGSDSNLSFGYPEFDKRKPYAPYSKDSYEAERYREEVEAYVKAAKRYVEAADEDMKGLRDAREEAVRKANRVVDEYNNWVQGY